MLNACAFADWLDDPAVTVDRATYALVVMLAAHAAAHGLGDWLPLASWARHVDEATTRRAEAAGLVALAVRDGVPGVRFTAIPLASVDTFPDMYRRQSARERMRRYRARLKAEAAAAPEPAPPPVAQPALTFEAEPAGSTCAKPVDVTADVTPYVTPSVTLDAAPLNIRARAAVQDLDPLSVVQEHDAPRRRPCALDPQVPTGGQLCALVGAERDADPALQSPALSARRRLYARVLAVARRARFLVTPERLSAAIRQVEVARSRSSRAAP